MRHNQDMPADVDGSGHVSAIDALIIINQLGRSSSTNSGELLVRNHAASSIFMDVNNDETISASDALIVINSMRPDSPIAVSLQAVDVDLQDMTWDGGGDGSSWGDPLNWSTDQVPNSTHNVVLDVAGDLEVILSGNQPAIGSLVNRESIWLQSSTSTGFARLTIEEDAINFGTIRMESVSDNGGNQASYLTANSGFTNASGGVIDVNVGAGDGRFLSGDFIHQGTIEVETGAELSHTGPGTLTFDGDSLISGAGVLVKNDGTFDFLSGDISPETTVYLNDSDVFIADTVTSDAVVHAVGDGILRGNESESATISIDGTLRFGFGRLTVESAAENHGHIITTSSSNNGGNQATYLAVAANSTLTNTPTGVISAIEGAGDSRFFSGHYVNQGLIEVLSPEQAEFTGRFDVDGGRVEGELFFQDSELHVLSSPALPTTLSIVGDDNQLATDNLANVELWVRGDIAFGFARLYAADGVANHGTIRLESSSDNGGNQASYLTADGILTNAEDGQIIVNQGAGDLRFLTGEIINRGAIEIPDTTLQVLGAGITNEFGGLIGGGGVLDTSASSLTGNGIIDFADASLVDASVETNQFNLRFFTPAGMDIATITDVSNYQLIASGGDGTFGDGNEVDLSSAIVNIQADSDGRRVFAALNQTLADDLYLINVDGDLVTDSDGVSLFAGQTVSAIRNLAINPTELSVSLADGADTGISSQDRLTNIASPTLNVEVNKPGTLTLDYDGDSIVDETRVLEFPDVIDVVPPPYADGEYRIGFVFTPEDGVPVEKTLTIEIDTTAPLLVDAAATQQAPSTSRVVTFDRPLDPASIDLATLFSLSDPGGKNVPITIVQDDPKAFTVMFASLVQPGDYELAISDVVTDLAGNVIDAGLVDSFSLVADVTKPFVTKFSPVTSINAAFSSVEVTFSELINQGSFTSDDVSITTPLGTVPATSVSVTPIDEQSFLIGFPSQSTDGDYEIEIGSQVLDLAGNAMSDGLANQTTVLNFDSSPGVRRIVEPEYGDRVTQSIQDLHEYGSTTSQPYTPHVQVQYGDPAASLKHWTLNYGDLQNPLYRDNTGDNRVQILLTADAGFEVDLHGFDLAGWQNSDHEIESVKVIAADSGAILYQETDVLIQGDFDGPRRSSFTFATLLSAPSILIEYTNRNSAGEFKDVGIDNITFGERAITPPADPGAFVGVVTIDSEAPIVSDFVWQPNAGIRSAIITFAEPIDETTMSVDDFTLSTPDGDVAIDALVRVNRTSYRIEFDHQTTSGDYQITVGPEISDLAGNFLAEAYVSPVHVVSLVDLVVPSVTFPATGTTDQLVDVEYRLSNQGLEPSLMTTRQSIYLSTDAVIGNDQLVFEDDITFDIPASQGIDRVVPVRMPNVPGDYWIIVVADSQNMNAESDETNNSIVSASPIEVIAEYSATVAADVTVANVNTPIDLVGTATKIDDSPAPFELVNLHLSVRGTTRIISAITDSDGNFATTFTPLPGEAGVYQVGATHPGVPTPTVQDEFEIIGFGQTGPSPTLSLIEAAPADMVQLQIDNLSDSGLTNLQATVIDSATNLDVTVALGDGSASPSIDGGSSIALFVAGRANDDSLLTSLITVEVTSDEGASITIVVPVEVESVAPRLTLSTTELRAAMVRGNQRSVSLTITNDGGSASGPIDVQIPSAPWLSLATPASMPSLDPGESVEVVVLLTPATDLPLQVFNGNLTIQTQAQNLSVPFAFRSVTDALADLQVSVVDEYFYFTDEMPRVSDAVVQVFDPFTDALVATGTTGDGGQVTIAQIPEGYYRVVVTAADHSPTERTLFLSSIDLQEELVFISRTTVSYTWTVTETEIQDVTTISVQSTFETNVPAPVMVLDNGHVDMARVPNIGDEVQIDMTLRNVGLVAIDEVSFSFASHPFYTITPLVTNIGRLSASSSLTVPVIVRRVADYSTVPDGTDVPCEIPARLNWGYKTGPHFVRKATAIPVINVEGSCPVVPLRPRGLLLGGSGSAVGGPALLTPVRINPTEFTCGDNDVCAQVVIVISQDFVQTRQAFDATLQLANGTTVPIEGIGLDIVITDEAGDDVTDRFVIQPPMLSAITAVDGTGILAANQVGTSNWVITPTSDAAMGEDTAYFVGGQFTYIEDDNTVTIRLTESPITVTPQPLLDVKYFQQRDVFSDDPHTLEIEPSQPFDLGVLVANNGAGIARDLRIDSAQPKIIENENGLLIDFKIIASEVAGQNLTPSLTADFGDLLPGEIAIATYKLTATLQGQFIEYEASLQHSDPSGDPRLVLFNSLEVHELIHTVSAYGALEDGKPDFLVNDVVDDDDLPDTLHLSDGSVVDVSLASVITFDSVTSLANLEVELTATAGDGWNYFKADDPGNGLFRLIGVQRLDGTSIPTENFWQTDRTFIEDGQRPIRENKLHLLDLDPTETYTLVFEPTDVAAPTATVDPLPFVATSRSVEVTVSAIDDGEIASGVESIDIYVSVDSGAFTLWTTVPATNPTATLLAESGRTYAFHSLARDNIGNVEAIPDAGIRIEAGIYVPDLDAPTTTIESVTTSGDFIEVEASAIDVGGSGVQSLELFLRVDGGNAESVGSVSIADGGTASFGVLPIADGDSHIYELIAVATDRSGNVTNVADTGRQSVTLTRELPNSLDLLSSTIAGGLTQRSYIRGVDLVFNDSNGLTEITNSGLQLVRLGASGDIDIDLSENIQANDSSIKLDFGSQGIGGDADRSTGDGIYELRIDLDVDGVVDDIITFHRLFGDINGDQVVNEDDRNLINDLYRNDRANLNGDLDGSGRVDGRDRRVVIKQAGSSV